jgi:uncharacterized DUF497 family protein
MLVFLDPLAPSILDDSEIEERWVIIGQTSELKLLLVVQTFVEYVSGSASVRIISARRLTRREARQYREGV